jgi:hypothetical protein
MMALLPFGLVAALLCVIFVKNDRTIMREERSGEESVEAAD